MLYAIIYSHYLPMSVRSGTKIACMETTFFKKVVSYGDNYAQCQV